MTLIKLLLVKF